MSSLDPWPLSGPLHLSKKGEGREGAANVIGEPTKNACQSPKEAFATLPGNQHIQYWDKENHLQKHYWEGITAKIQAISGRTGTGTGFSSQLDFSFCWVGQIVDVFPILHHQGFA